MTIYRTALFTVALAVFALAQTDVFVGVGSDLVRPGLLPKANLGIGVGHSFKALNWLALGNEPTASYTYESAGSHGWLHTAQSAHTEALGLMRNFTTRREVLTFYTWPQIGITTLTGGARTANRLSGSAAVGAAVHFTRGWSLWFQAALTKVAGSQLYPTPSVNLVYSR